MIRAVVIVLPASDPSAIDDVVAAQVADVLASEAVVVGKRSEFVLVRCSYQAQVLEGVLLAEDVIGLCEDGLAADEVKVESAIVLPVARYDPVSLLGSQGDFPAGHRIQVIVDFCSCFGHCSLIFVDLFTCEVDAVQMPWL